MKLILHENKPTKFSRLNNETENNRILNRL